MSEEISLFAHIAVEDPISEPTEQRQYPRPEARAGIGHIEGIREGPMSVKVVKGAAVPALDAVRFPSRVAGGKRNPR
jgi:hypothetical protein